MGMYSLWLDLWWEQGLPEEGIEPGTKWEDVPVDWVCPDCGVGKEDFDMVPLEGGKSY